MNTKRLLSFKKMGQQKSNGTNSTPKPSPVKVLGVEFAPKPWAIPWERRVQVLSIILWFLVFIVWPVISYHVFLITFLLTIWTQNIFGWILCGLGIPYVLWMWFFDMETSHRGGRPSEFVRSWRWWKWYSDYFPIKLVKTADLDPSKNYLFGGHPHGLLCTGVLACFGMDANNAEEKFPGFQFSILTFETSFMFPIAREIALWLGLCSASRRSMNYLLSQRSGGRIAILIPGGAPEALDFCPGTYILRLKKRKGFIKVALQNGSPLVPVFSFGENEVLNQIPNPDGSWLRWMQDKFQQLFTIPPVLFYGRGVFQYTLGFLPKRQPITVVVGAPIPVEKVDAPTQSQIDELHEKYVKSLTKLFEDHKAKYSPNPDDTLVIK